MAVIHFSKVKQVVLHQKWWIFHIENVTFSISQTSHFTSSIVASMNKRTGKKRAGSPSSPLREKSMNLCLATYEKKPNYNLNLT